MVERDKRYFMKLRLGFISRLVMLAVFSFLATNLVALPQVAKEEEKTSNHVKVGIEEKLGQNIPMDLKFKDENGDDITLRQMSNGKPLIIDMAYYTCPGICDEVLASLTSTIDEVSETPGQDFNVATVSFDPADNSEIALKKKEQYWGLLRRPFPANDWRFLTGDSANISRLTNSIGFYYMRDMYLKFTHPTALVIVDKDGKIIRYIKGSTFTPVDLKMAIMEAKAGTPEQIISSVIAVCFSRDPSGQHLVFNIMQVVGIGTLVFIAGFIVFLRSTRRSKSFAKYHESGSRSTGQDSTSRKEIS
jgi:protein SCO1/2